MKRDLFQGRNTADKSHDSFSWGEHIIHINPNKHLIIPAYNPTPSPTPLANVVLYGQKLRNEYVDFRKLITPGE